jgi:hypothetical protein
MRPSATSPTAPTTTKCLKCSTPPAALPLLDRPLRPPALQTQPCPITPWTRSPFPPPDARQQSEDSIQYVPHSPPPSVQEVSPPPLRVRLNPPEGEPYAPLSPGLAETLIRLSGDEFSEIVRTVAYGLAATVERRTTIAAQQLTAARTRINHLAGALETCNKEIRRLRARAGHANMPHNFELNNGRIDAQIPSQQGGNVLAKWIKVLGSGEVVARAGEDPNEPEYVVPLHLATNYSPGDVDTMPYWCEELLQSNRAAFFALATTVHALDLTASAKVERYHRHHERRAQLEADRHAIIVEIEREDEELTSIRHHLEGWQLHE